MKTTLLFLIATAMLSCSTPQGIAPTPTPSASPSPQASPSAVPSSLARPKCPEYFDFTLARVNGPLKMPATGKLVLESHLVSIEDGLSSFPKDTYDKAAEHIAKSCALLKKRFPEADCAKVYGNRYVKQWTPSESGAIGQGSTGKKPPLDCEMWTVNQYWKPSARPQPGSRYMIEANGKHVIACAGYETGPGSPAYIGGAQGEVFVWLGITNQSQVKMGLINDQSLPFGPLDCQ